jgi:hypothetical protein
MESEKKEIGDYPDVSYNPEFYTLFNCSYGDWRDECLSFDDGSKDLHFATS